MKRRREQQVYTISKRRRGAAPTAFPRRRSRRNVRTGGFLGIEKKFLDTELTASALATTWAALNPVGVDSLSIPAQGDGESNRDGRTYAIESVHVRGHFELAAAEGAGVPASMIECRVIVYWDTQTNGAEATATDIMDAGGTTDILAFRNLQNSKRFKVLYDKVCLLKPHALNEGAVNSFANGAVIQRFEFNKQFKKPIIVNCTGTTSSVASVSDNNIGIAAIGTSSNATIAYQARVRFVG